MKHNLTSDGHCIYFAVMSLFLSFHLLVSQFLVSTRLFVSCVWFTMVSIPSNHYFLYGCIEFTLIAI